MDFSVCTEIDSEDIAWEMAKQLTHEEMLDFIAALDGLIADWSFTEMVYDWAREQHKEYLAESEEIQREMRYS
jgi:hypothetical protein